jgi:hypothetical protein
MPAGRFSPDEFPVLSSPSGPVPWPADILDGHMTLKVAYNAASRALNLDESDPIRLRHYEKQIKAVMLSTLQALAARKRPSIPEDYIEGVANAIRKLAGAMTATLGSSLKWWVRRH